MTVRISAEIPASNGRAEVAPAGAVRLRRTHPAEARARPRVALLVEPRFPGGTASAVASEIRALAPHVRLSVIGLNTAMFRNRPVNPAIAEALAEVSLPLTAEPAIVHADTIVLHNPTCLRFDEALGPRLSAGRTVVVTHENFLRPGGREAFDVAHCLGLIAGRIAAGERLLAPVAAGNRRSVAAWLGQRQERGWQLAPDDWPNICDHAFLAPAASPRDRRGRHSRPGFDKFPSMDALRAQFPPWAERCAILGADTLLRDAETLPRHWELLRFGEMKVPQFLAGIDFFVYFTHSLLRESYGRAISEAVAAGKLVITDPETAEAFGLGIVDDSGEGIDRIVAEHIADPGRYAAAVLQAQADLASYRPEPLVSRLLALINAEVDVHALL